MWLPLLRLLVGLIFIAIVAAYGLGPVVELADTQVLGACAERCAGSSPARATLLTSLLFQKIFTIPYASSNQPEH